MSQKRERSNSFDEEDEDEDRQPRDHRRSTSHEDSSSENDSEASSEQLKMLKASRRKKIYVELDEHHFDWRSHGWRDPPLERIDQPSTSGTRRSSGATESSKSRCSRPRRRASSIDDPITFSADWYKRIRRKNRTEPGPNPETRRVRRRSRSPTRHKKNPSRDHSSKSYGSEVAHGSKRNILPDLQGHVANIPPQENVQNESNYPLHQSSWNPDPEASSSLHYSQQQYPDIPPTLPSVLPLSADPRSDQGYLHDQTTRAESFSGLSYAIDQQFTSTAPRQTRADKRKAVQANLCRTNLIQIQTVEDAALPVESSTATPVTAPTTLQAKISSTSSSAESTPLQPEGPNVEFTSTSIKSEIEKPSDDSMIVASTAQMTVADLMSTITTTATQTAASTSVSTAASNVSEPKTSATLSLPTRQIDISSGDEDCEE